MKQVIIAGVFWAMAAPSALAHGENAAADVPAQGGVMVLDFEAAISSTPDAKTMQERLKARFDAQEAELMAQQQKVRDLSLRVRNESVTMTDEQRAQLSREYSDAHHMQSSMVNDLQNALDRFRAEERERMTADVVAAAEAVRAANNYAAIITADGVIAFDPARDITDQVIAEVNSKVIAGD